MDLLSSMYTDAFREAVSKHQNDAWDRLISDLQNDIDDEFLTNSSVLSERELHIANQQRAILQKALTLLTTHYEE